MDMRPHGSSVVISAGDACVGRTALFSSSVGRPAASLTTRDNRARTLPSVQCGAERASPPCFLRRAKRAGNKRGRD